MQFKSFNQYKADFNALCSPSLASTCSSSLHTTPNLGAQGTCSDKNSQLSFSLLCSGIA